MLKKLTYVCTSLSSSESSLVCNFVGDLRPGDLFRVATVFISVVSKLSEKAASSKDFKFFDLFIYLT